ncbi:Ada metal-binding domain-containing protein [Candidatus Flexifilum breve]
MPAQAEDAGFRPCKRCHPRQAHITDPRLVSCRPCATIHAHIDQPGR